MLEPKVLKLLEMAERGELPEDCNYPSSSGLIFGWAFISNGKLTEFGKTKLSAHRYDTCHEVKHDCLCKQCNKPPNCELTPETKKQIAFEYCKDNSSTISVGVPGASVLFDGVRF